MEEREEGEISDGNEDSFGLSYKPVARPDAGLYRRVEHHVPSSDEDYSSDSDSDSPLAAKRKRPNVSKMDTGGSHSRPIAKARRRNNVWSSVMQEQVLAQEIGGFGLKRRLDQGDRSVESYDYLQARQFREQENQHYSDEEEEEEEDEETKNKR
ncbi:Phosphorylated adapter RNA export protein [Portunus trituberculatus]|uniref:Phosphorylated adapter RNA export protein n=1 Tax=Portunus trituberculatus TaxID=210409 RepID=A0A5B7D0F6_PORTR|nr:Phosphorylated adapter RNA export protein [Portunus trituberculatus]